MSSPVIPIQSVGLAFTICQHKVRIAISVDICGRDLNSRVVPGADGGAIGETVSLINMNRVLFAAIDNDNVEKFVAV